MKIKLSKDALLVGGVFTLLIFFAVFYVSTNQKAETVHAAESVREGYETIPAQVRVYAPYSLKWQEASGFGKFIGFVFFSLMWVAIWYVDNDKHLGKQREGDNAVKGKQKLGKWMIGVPLILCVISLFASYSASLDKNSVVITEKKWQEIKDDKDAIKALFVK